MNNRRYILIRKFVVVFCLVTLFSAVLETKAFAGSFGCIFGMSNGCIAPTPTPNNTVSPQTTMQTMLQTMTKIAAVEQDLMFAQEFYQYMKSLKYMTAAPGLMGAVGYVSNLTSGISSMGQMGVMEAQNTATAFGGPGSGLSPNELANLSGTLAVTASTAGSLSSMSNTISMINTQNGGSGGLALLNGASLGTQAALTGAQALVTIESFRQQEKMRAQLVSAQTSARTNQATNAEMPQRIHLPCNDMAAWPPTPNMAQTGSCPSFQTGVPAQFNNSIGTGANKNIQNFTSQQYVSAMQNGQNVTPPTLPPPISVGVPITFGSGGTTP